MRRFWSDTKGNIAVLFALAIVPIIGGIGAAVDYSMASAYRTDMQKALDSTALALTKILPADEEIVSKVGMEYFLTSLGNHNLSDLKLTITPEAGIVKLKATGNYQPAIANILGVDQFEIGTEAEARWSLGKLEIALVLDVSLSMNSLGRIQALRTATVTEPGTCTSCATVDTPMSDVCTNIKDSGIKIYSIRLIDGNTNLIRNCASDPSMYYDVQNAGQLAAVFNSIGSEIASLHLSK
jgi:Flp pilus assembly protein TadG